MNKALYPGSFNPIHDGHTDIIKRASKLFDFLYVVVSNNSKKPNQLDIKIRTKQAKKEIDKLHLKNVKVISNLGLTIDLAKKLNCKYIIHGIRSTNELKEDLDMSKTNYYLEQSIETVLFVSKKELKNISSSKIRKIQEEVKKFKNASKQ